MTCTDRFPERRHDLLMELTATDLDTYHLFSPPTLVTVYLITRERDDVPSSDVTATNWLRAFVRTETTHPQACASTGDTLY